MGLFMFNQYDKNELTQVSNFNLDKRESIYFVQYGVYSNKDNMINAMKNINYTYSILNNKYYVYIGMTKDINNLNKLKEYFKKLNYNIYIKEQEVDVSFSDTLEQYDLMLKEVNSSESIKTILKSIIAKYEEMYLNDQNQRNTNWW